MEIRQVINSTGVAYGFRVFLGAAEYVDSSPSVLWQFNPQSCSSDPLVLERARETAVFLQSCIRRNIQHELQPKRDSSRRRKQHSQRNIVVNYLCSSLISSWLAWLCRGRSHSHPKAPKTLPNPLQSSPKFQGLFQNYYFFLHESLWTI